MSFRLHKPTDTTCKRKSPSRDGLKRAGFGDRLSSLYTNGRRWPASEFKDTNLDQNVFDFAISPADLLIKIG